MKIIGPAMFRYTTLNRTKKLPQYENRNYINTR